MLKTHLTKLVESNFPQTFTANVLSTLPTKSCEGQ